MNKFWRIFFWLVAILAVLVLIVPLLIPVPPLDNVKPVEELLYPDSQFVEVNGLSVHYQRAGSGDPIIILLHGFGASTFSWREVMQPLAGYGTVIAYDRPAQGFTDRPLYGEWQEPNPYSLDTQPDLLVGLMDQLGIEQAILVGNSAGGTVSMLTALQYPERVTRLVLVDPAIYSSGSDLPGWVRRLMFTPQASRLGPLLVRSIQTRGMELLNTAWHDPSRIPQEAIDGYRKPLQVQNWDKALWELTRAPRQSQPALGINELNLPVLVVTGDDDRIVPTENSVRLAREIKGADLVVFPACGHVPQEECPDAFMKALSKFITNEK